MGEYILTVPCLSFSPGGEASGSVNLVSPEWRANDSNQQVWLLFLNHPSGIQGMLQFLTHTES